MDQWGLGDEASSTSIDISGQLKSKLDRNGDEMRGDLKMNGFAITGLPTNINLIADDSDAASYSVCNELLNCCRPPLLLLLTPIFRGQRRPPLIVGNGHRASSPSPG